MRQSSAKAIGWLVLVTTTGLFGSALYRQEWDVWAEAQLRKNAEPQPIGLIVHERYGAKDDADEIYPTVAVVASRD